MFFAHIKLHSSQCNKNIRKKNILTTWNNINKMKINNLSIEACMLMRICAKKKKIRVSAGA